jgi:hypothetical protein
MPLVVGSEDAEGAATAISGLHCAQTAIADNLDFGQVASPAVGTLFGAKQASGSARVFDTCFSDHDQNQKKAVSSVIRRGSVRAYRREGA